MHEINILRPTPCIEIKSYRLHFTGDDGTSLEMQLPACKTDDTLKDKNKSCQFPYKYRGTLYRECITEGSDDGRAWCATAVNKRRRMRKGKWGNCDPKTCTSLNFDETGLKNPLLDCIRVAHWINVSYNRNIREISISFYFAGVCPKGFIAYKKRCYGFFVSRYWRTTWRLAQKACRSFNGGDLVSILRKDENDFIARKFVELNPSLGDEEYHYPWIGAYLRKRQNPSKQLSEY